MKLSALLISVVCVLFSCTLRGAGPLAQQYVVVHKVRDLDDPAKAVCVGTPDILQLPSGRLIASMELWLKRPTSGDEGGIDYPNHCKIKSSDDGGRTWRQISTNGITWGSLFYVNDALHMIGNDPHKRDIRIIRSPDDGRTWSEPVTLFDDSRYHGSATPVHVKDGFVYRAFEDMTRGSASLVVAGDLSKDLLDPAAWRRLNRPLRAAMRFNNTLLGRMILGPPIATARMYRSDLRLLAKGDRTVAGAWLLHGLGAVPVVLWLSTAGEVPAAGYALCAYLGLSILNVRTFLEHRADESVHARCVVVEDRGLLALLFLNNNFHAVHHARPKLPWYAIPRYYRENREHFLALNRGYRFASYAEVFRRYALRQKEPVAHPLIAKIA